MRIVDPSDYIMDGELHALSDGFGYAGYIIDEPVEFSNDDPVFLKYTSSLIGKYNYYRNEHGHKPIPSFRWDTPFGNSLDDVHFIYRPAYNDELHQPATLGIKFKRYENDGLDDANSR